MTSDDLSARRPVWVALSDLYLDTDVTDACPYVARVLADSPFPVEHLRHMLFHEVHPVVRVNLLAATGVWTGFDPDWLVERIVRRRAWPRWRRVAARPFDRLLRSCAQDLWSQLLPLVVAARAQRAGAA